MRRTMLAALLVGATAAPTVCFALMYSVEGNKPQSAGNYKRWPGLIDVVNQPSRQRLVWCNGAESFSYAGDTDALNVTLQRFAKVKCPTHSVVFRPGPLFGKFDWELNIVEGIVRHFVEQEGISLVRNLDPTLTVYVSDKLDLNSVKLPSGVQLQQIHDLRSRYTKAQMSDIERVRSEATAHLKSLTLDPVIESLGKEKYHAQLRRIAGFVERTSKRQ